MASNTNDITRVEWSTRVTAFKVETLLLVKQQVSVYQVSAVNYHILNSNFFN